MTFSKKILSFTLFALVSTTLFAADPAPANDKAAPNPAKQAIAVRKAAFTLISNSFKPLGDVVKGNAEYNQADIEKRAKQIVVLSEFLDNTFPDISNLGEPDTKAKADIWTQRPEFDKRLKEFQQHAATLMQVAAKEKTASDAFKEAVGAVGKDCKGCHETFKAK